jgi:hypothetical protein
MNVVMQLGEIDCVIRTSRPGSFVHRLERFLLARLSRSVGLRDSLNDPHPSRWSYRPDCPPQVTPRIRDPTGVSSPVADESNLRRTTFPIYNMAKDGQGSGGRFERQAHRAQGAAEEGL